MQHYAGSFHRKRSPSPSSWEATGNEHAQRRCGSIGIYKGDKQNAVRFVSRFSKGKLCPLGQKENE